MRKPRTRFIPPRGTSGGSDARAAEPTFEFVIAWQYKGVPQYHHYQTEWGEECQSRVYAETSAEAIEKIRRVLPDLPEDRWDCKYEWVISIKEVNEVPA